MVRYLLSHFVLEAIVSNTDRHPSAPDQPPSRDHQTPLPGSALLPGQAPDEAMFLDRPFTLDRVVRWALAGALVWALVRLMGVLSEALIPFAVAWLGAYLLHPLVNRVQRVVPSRLGAVFLTLAGLAGVLVLAVWLTAPLVAEQVGRAATLVKDLAGDSDLARRAAQRLPPDLWQAFKDLTARPEVRDALGNAGLPGLARKAASMVLPGIWGVVTGTANVLMGLMGLVVVGLYLVFLLMDFEAVRTGWRGLLPPRARPGVEAFVDEFAQGMQRYFRAQALVAALVGVLLAVGFSLVGLPLAILLGLFIGLLNMVPYLQIVGYIPAFALAILHALQSDMSMLGALGLTALVLAVVQVVQDGFLVPRIMGRVTGLTPAAILLALSVWGTLLGMLGLLIAIPSTCLALAWYKRLAGVERPLSGDAPDQGSVS